MSKTPSFGATVDERSLPPSARWSKLDQRDWQLLMCSASVAGDAAIDSGL